MGVGPVCNAFVAHQVFYIPGHPGGIPPDHRPGGEIPGDHAPGPHQGILTNGDEWEEGDVGPNLGAPLDGGAPHALRGKPAPGVRVVCHSNPGSQEDIVINLRILGYVDLAMDLDIVSDAASIVHDGVAPDTEIVAYSVLLPDDDVVAGFQMVTNGGAGVDNSAAPDNGPGANYQRARAGGTGAKVAQHGPPFHQGALSQLYLTPRGHRVPFSAGRGINPSSLRLCLSPPLQRDLAAASRMFTTLRPMRPSLAGC